MLRGQQLMETVFVSRGFPASFLKRLVINFIKLGDAMSVMLQGITIYRVGKENMDVSRRQSQASRYSGKETLRSFLSEMPPSPPLEY